MKIQILGRDIEIFYVSSKRLNELSETSKDECCLGFFNGTAIYVDKDLDKEVEHRVLFHEICHVILSISGLSLVLKDDLEEAVCTVMESMATILKQEEVRKLLK